MSRSVGVKPGHGVTGTVFRPGLSLSADHLTREFEFTLLTALGGASRVWGRSGVLSGDGNTFFENNEKSNGLTVRPFSFMLACGFSGETLGDLILEKTADSSSMEVSLVRFENRELTAGQENKQTRFFLDPTTNPSALDSLALYWDQQSGTLWPEIADLRATKDWKAKANDLKSTLLSLANALRDSGGGTAVATGLQIFAAQGQAFPLRGPWWRDSVIEAARLAIMLVKWASGETPAHFEEKQDFADPKELLKEIDTLQDDLKKLIANLQLRPWNKPELVLDDQAFLQIQLAKADPARDGVWIGLLDLSKTKPDFWRDTSALVVFTPADVDSLKIALQGKPPSDSEKQPKIRWPDVAEFRFRPQAQVAYSNSTVNVELTMQARGQNRDLAPILYLRKS